MRKLPLLLILLLIFGVPVFARQSGSSFETSDCPFDLPDGEVEGQTIDCGTLNVPEDHNDPNGATIQLAVAILYSPEAESDPVLYLSGGPGASALEEVADWTESPIRENRDVILLDQRGTGSSVPALDCTDYAEEDDPVQACHDALVADGVNLSAYNSIQSAGDIADLREALGYDEWNLLGISYGTRLALVVLRDHPEGVRSVILDSVYPPQVNDWEEVSSDQIETFTVLFQGCAADPACDAAYPDLENVFYETVDRLNSEPASYDSIDADGNSIEATLSGDDLAEALYQALYMTDNIPYLPYVLFSVSEGNYQALDDLNTGAIFDFSHGEDSGDGDYNSVTCSEEVPFVDYDRAIADAESVRPEMRAGAVASIESIFETCRVWDVEPAPAIEAEAVSSDLPALVLAGEYDPATPVKWAKDAARTLSSSFFFEFPGVGHGTLDGGDCPVSIILAFLDDPLTEPDSQCIAEMSAPEFVTQ